MNSYRKEGFFAYIKLHTHDVLLNLIKSRMILIFAFLLFLSFAIFSGSIKSISNVLIWSVSIVVYGYMGILYLFPMIVHYKIFKRSSEQFDAISNLIIRINRDCKVISSSVKVSAWDRIMLRESDLDFDFEVADIFETENSIFIFPISKLLGNESRFRVTKYLPTIRLLRRGTEKIIGTHDIYTIFEFSEKNEGTDKVLEFRDKIFKNKVKLRIKEYNS